MIQFFFFEIDFIFTVLVQRVNNEPKRTIPISIECKYQIMFHFVVLAEDAIKAALNDYKVKQQGGNGGGPEPQKAAASN